MIWPFKRKEETRAASGFTSEVIAAREAYISGARGLAELTGTVQSCVSLWEGGLSLADVEGADMLTRSALAHTARSLALKGESLWLIRDDRLIPCYDWDVRTADGAPTAYRLTVPEAGGGRSLTALAAEVLHFRIGSDPAAPWLGQSPLRRAQLSAEMLHALEKALGGIYADAPLGSIIIPMPSNTPNQAETFAETFRNRQQGRSFIVQNSVTAGNVNAPAPRHNNMPEQLTPDLQRLMPKESLDAARGSIAMAFGVLPALLNQATTGPVVREAQRHLAQWMLAPIAGLIAEEVQAKMGGPVEIDVMRPLQAFDAGGRARAAATLIQALATAKEAGVDASEALRIVDWE
ncbi:phage portal protein [Ovoidimarina sediminis]|uniref:phage portal protein n=1 Tax=Ovoidimarina sediminis TaxID=3079856 RepID=UPI0029081AD0|nr:phage portal protein [Rhodophyticola sp. MJ-SS7]MDU8946110.1 phage portal protein [Rhodophyticola sp. MJ-SS7]